MIKKIKIKLITLFLVVLSTIMICFTIVLSTVSQKSILELGKYAIDVDKKNIKETATLLFLQITKRTAEEYSSYFNNILRVINLLAKYSNFLSAEGRYSDHIKTKMQLKEIDNKELFVDSAMGDRRTAIYWGEKNDFPKAQESLNNISSWFYPYVNSLLDLHQSYLYTIWLLYPDKGLYISDGYDYFNDKKGELEFYRNIPDKEFLKNYLSVFVDRAAKSEKALCWKPYKGISGGVDFSIVAPVFKNEKSKTLKYVVGADLNLEKILQALGKAKMITENSVKESGSSSSIYSEMDGFTFILDKYGDIILFPENQIADFEIKSNPLDKIDFGKYITPKDAIKVNLGDSINPQVKSLKSQMVKNDSGVRTVNLKGVNHIIAFSTICSTGWTLGFVTHEKALMQAANQTRSKMLHVENSMRLRFRFIALIFLIIAIVVIMLFFRKLIFKPIKKIRRELRKLGMGKFDITLDDSIIWEIDDLSKSSVYLGEKLQDYTANLKKEIAARQAIQTEIDIAGKMQKSILPVQNKFRDYTSFELCSILNPAKDISGDFYDFFKLDDERIAFLIADVSGKGMQAAFFMAMSKIVIKTFSLKLPDSPGKVLETANNILSRDNKSCMFVTVFLAFYNVKSGEITCANAGHHDPILLKHSGEAELLEISKNELAAGLFDGATYTDLTIKLQHGETIILYTDGVVEAASPDKEEYGEERFINIIKTNHDQSIIGLIDNIIDDVRKFEDGNQFDDVTLVLLKRK